METTEKAEQASRPPNWTVAHAFGEMVWLMTQAQGYKHHSLGDLEWLLMPALLLEQYRIFHEEQRPIGAIVWARLDSETGTRMTDGRYRLRPDQWRSGDEVWIIDVIAAAAGPATLVPGMIDDFKRNVFPAVAVKLRRMNEKTGQIDVLELRPTDVESLVEAKAI